MGFQLSPGVSITETDLTTIVPAVATTAAAFCGKFQWGPADEITLITKENELRTTFGLPLDANAQDWFTASSFLSYGTNLQVVRVIAEDATTPAQNAVAADGTDGAILIKNDKHYNDQSEVTLATAGSWIAKYPGELGNSLKVVVLDSGPSTDRDADYDTWIAEFDSDPSTSDACKALAGWTDAEITADNGTAVNDELHVLVIDSDGVWTGTANTVLERFAYVSKATNANRPDGTSNYYKKVINKESKYIWWGKHANESEDSSGTADWGTDCAPGDGATYSTLNDSYASNELSGGVTDFEEIDGADVVSGFEEHFSNADVVDVSLLICGQLTATQAASIVDIAEERKDCIAFISCQEADQAHSTLDKADCITYRNAINRSSSYAVLDSGWKYLYDRYNDSYHYIPLNGDIAGCTVQTDLERDPWWSPAGFNRGRIRNVVKLPFNPSKTERDELYSAQINPVVTFEGEGTILFGDKTMLTRPSAFDRINVRRLFIVLEKSIATAAKYSLFEFNDFFTRQQFISMVTPFLREVQGRRGIQDFKVICDETNNTPQVIDSNNFVADIFIKPNRVINYIQLNFIATPTGMNFDEIGG